MPHPDEPLRLSRRLRQLREGHWPDRRLTQHDVADALQVAVSSVSSWESAKSPKIPPSARLTGYATFFATRRSIDTRPRLLDPAELTEAERSRRNQLAEELRLLRAAAVGEADASAGDRPRSLWHFPDGAPVRLVCGTLSQAPPYASAQDHNYMQLSGYADVDALVELFGHIRGENPHSDVRFELAPRVESDDLLAHLVLLGGTAVNQAAERTASSIDLPLRQVMAPGLTEGEVFQRIDDPSVQFSPKFVVDDPMREVVEDVGLFFRTPNPNRLDRTLTICSGVFTRGVYGAVRLLTDSDLRDENEAQLQRLFRDAATFGVLMRVRVFDHATSTPDLRDPATLLYSWPRAA